MRTRWFFQQLSRAASAARLGCGDLKKKNHAPQICLSCMYVCMFWTCFPQAKWQSVACFARAPQRAYQCICILPMLDLFWEKSGQVSQSFNEKFSTLTRKPYNIYNCISTVCPSRHWAGVIYLGLDTSSVKVNTLFTIIPTLWLS